MYEFFQQFRVYGEIAEMVMLDVPSRRLLVDIASEPSHGDTQIRNRNLVTLTITDDELIDRFMSEVSVGDVATASGSFHQSGYVPHKTTYIDTILLVADFQRLDKQEFVHRYEPVNTRRPDHVTLH